MKIFIFLSIILLMTSCGNITNSSQDSMFLQTLFKREYKVDKITHVCIDSLNNVFVVTMTTDGEIDSKVKVN